MTKWIGYFSAFAIVAGVTLLQTGVSSCGRPVTDTVYVKDPGLGDEDTLISTALLTSTPWKIQELRCVTNNVPDYYLRGGGENTCNFDDEHITFHADKTGVYIDGNKTVIPLTWDFLTDDKTSLYYILKYPEGDIRVTWEYTRYKNGALVYTDFFYNSYTDANAHSFTVRVPLKSQVIHNVR